MPGDARPIADVHVAAWRWAYRDDLSDRGLGRAQRWTTASASWAGWLGRERPGAGTVVAIADGRVVGFCSFGPCRDDGATERTAEVLTIYLL